MGSFSFGDLPLYIYIYILLHPWWLELGQLYLRPLTPPLTPPLTRPLTPPLTVTYSQLHIWYKNENGRFSTHMAPFDKPTASPGTEFRPDSREIGPEAWTRFLKKSFLGLGWGGGSHWDQGLLLFFIGLFSYVFIVFYYILFIVFYCIYFMCYILCI